MVIDKKGSLSFLTKFSQALYKFVKWKKKSEDFSFWFYL